MKELFEKVWFKHVALVAAIILVWQLGALGLRNKAKSIGNEILLPIKHNSCIQKRGIITWSEIDQNQKEKLANVFNRIENLKEKHKKGFLEFYPYYFASSALLLMLSSISLVIIFLTLQSGIKEANQYLKTTFFTMAALTSFYSISPLVFKVEANITSNLNKYIAYDNLQEEIYNYAITQKQLTNPKDEINFNDFQLYISKRMIELNSIDTQFDLKAIPLRDYKIN